MGTIVKVGVECGVSLTFHLQVNVLAWGAGCAFGIYIHYGLCTFFLLRLHFILLAPTQPGELEGGSCTP
eukprot:scaffold117750_cov21-Tisochrysis_lutea.AAC.1